MVSIIGWRLLPKDAKKEKYLYQTASFIIHYQYKLKSKSLPFYTVHSRLSRLLFYQFKNRQGELIAAFLQFILFLSCKQNPIEVSFEQSIMRNHILKCLRNNRLKMFPQTEHSKKIRKEKVIKLELYCTCRQIWVESDNRVFDK